MFFRDRQRIIRKNENIRAQRVEDAAEMAEENDIDAIQNHPGHANGTAGASSTLAAGATSTTSLAAPALEERRPSAAFKPPPPPPEKQWEQKGVHYRSEGGVMHIHKSDSSKLSTGPGDEAEKEPLMSALMVGHLPKTKRKNMNSQLRNLNLNLNLSRQQQNLQQKIQ